MRRIALVLGLVACFACDGDGINYPVSGPDSAVPGLDGGVPPFDGGPMPGEDAQVTPVGDGAIGPGAKSGSVVSVPAGFTVAEEPYKYTPKGNGVGSTDVKVSGPSGMTSDGTTVAWEPTKGQSGKHEVTVEATVDGKSVEQAYTVTVAVSEKKAGGSVDAQKGGQVTVTSPTSKSRGAGVSVPSGSVSEATNIVVAEVDKMPARPNAAGNAQAVDFGPRGTVFAKPALVTLPLPSDVVLSRRKLSAHVFNPRGYWERVKVVAVDLENRLMTARASHFSLYAATQSGLDFDAQLVRMNPDAACAGDVIGRAVLDASLAELSASSIQNLPAELLAAVEANEESVEGLIGSSDFRGSLRAVVVLELLNGDGELDSERAFVATLFVSEDGRATLTQADALGNVLGQVTYPNLSSAATLGSVSARLRGAAAVAHFGDSGLETAALGARLHFLYDAEDLSLEPVDLENLGIAVAELAPEEPAEIPLAASTLDVDCDGLASDQDMVDGRALPHVEAAPRELVSIVAGEATTLSAELVRGPDGASLTWEVLEDAPATLSETDVPSERRFSASEPGRYYVRAFAELSGATLETVFVVDVVPMPASLALPDCRPATTLTAVKVGEARQLRAVLGDGNVPSEALVIEWGVVPAEGDPSQLVASSELIGRGHEAWFTPLATGEQRVGCRAVLGDAGGEVGSLLLSALSPEQNLAPLDLTLSPPSTLIRSAEGLTLQASGFDPEGDDLEFSWSSTGGTLSDETDLESSSSVEFRATVEGVYEVQVAIGDGSAPAQRLVATVIVRDGAFGTVDADGDGWPVGGGTLGDCDDSNPAVHPTALDACGDAIDDDCDGAPRTEDCDGDGFRAAQGDCDDEDDRVFPGASELCDGLDNDCDQRRDEDFGSEDSCFVGVGECAVLGESACSADQLYAVCTGTPGTPVAELCDELDNDCNGEVDEGGVCPDCVPTSGIDDTCNQLDDDCDGTLDDDYEARVTSCGEGACAAQGLSSCLDGEERDSCAPGTPATVDALCDGVDEDCDGEIDEDFAVFDSNCGVGACANVGEVSCVDGAQVDGCEPLPGTDLDADCNGVDDDCDGAIDEDFVSESTNCGIGACAATGATSCVQGERVDSCTAGEGAPADTLCNGLDDDCDGAIDDDFASETTSCGVGACAAEGRTVCIDGEPSNDCNPGQAAASDVTCNDIDDDCDGSVDEEFAPEDTNCGVGQCASNGVTSCEAGVVQDSCRAGVPASTDLCDGLDNDCDGDVDENHEPVQTTCGLGACGRVGAIACLDGTPVDTCTEGPRLSDSDQTCDGVDDDCDGDLDEEYQPRGTECGQGACGNEGVTSCESGVELDSCEPLEGGTNDLTCDGVDDDCDGDVDEDFASFQTSCGLGVCQATGTASCQDGEVVSSCVAGEPGIGDACDGLDNDCDGELDEEHVETPTRCGDGVCEGTGVRACQDGELVDTCTTTSPTGVDDDCNGLDDDCDGVADDGYQQRATTCGVGACNNEGVTVCDLGVESDTCLPLEPAASDASCDGVDDDCNGEIDDGFLSLETSCGAGLCAGSGLLTCVEGVPVDSCVENEGLPQDASCDGVDDDCDGLTDEDYVSSEVECGVGACRAVGSLDCFDGEVIDSCAPGLPLAEDDVTCDLVDDDCSGLADEDYAPSDCEAEGSLGACALGSSSCVEGAEACTPSAPGDEVCNGEDDDCNGDADDIPADECFTGLEGVCQAGHAACVTNELSCVPDQAPSEESCNDLDDDCDGAVDEDEVCGCIPSTEICNGADDDCNEAIDDVDGECNTELLGVCSFGFFVCEGFELLCVPATQPSEESCNDQDDDCDGEVDEDGACECVPSTEICNGEDDDCNEAIDDVRGECNTELPGICGLGHFECEGFEPVCVPNDAPRAEVGEACSNGVDDDCDGLSDADDGDCDCTPKPELCNDLDDDCDGVSDNGITCPPPPGDMCQTPTPITLGEFPMQLAGYSDDAPSSCAPGSVDRWFSLEAPQGGILSVTFSGREPPAAYAVRVGPCGQSEQLFCGAGTFTVAPGPVLFLVEGKPTADFTMNVSLTPVR